MGLFDWTERSSAVLSQGGVIDPDATKLAPILKSFEPSIAILASGIGALFFLPATGG